MAIEAECPVEQAFVLPVPLVEQRRLTPGALEAQTGTLRVSVHEHGRLVWRDTTTPAALESGGRSAAEAELARRGGRPEPVR